MIGIAHSDDPQHYDHVRRLGPWCNAVVGVSAVITKRLRLMPELTGIPTYHIPYGVSGVHESAVDGEAADCGTAKNPDDTIQLLYAGRLEQQQKRVGDLALILHALHQRGISARLTIAGDGSARSDLRKALDDLHLARHVSWLGTVAPADMPDLYRSHPVLLLPSAYEGLPLAVIEAMVHGCIPVVSAIASGIPELIENGVNGFCVPIGDSEGFADRLYTLATEAGRREGMSAAAKATITGDYTLNAMVQRYIGLFQLTWQDLVNDRYRRPLGALSPPHELTWRHRLRALFARW